MSKRPLFLRRMSWPLATVLGVALTMAAQSIQVLAAAGHARLHGFTQADGVNLFALTLRASAGPRSMDRATS